MALKFEELVGVRVLQEEFDREKQRLLALRVVANSTTSRLDGVPHAQALTSKVEKLVLRMVECEKKISQLGERIVEAKLLLIEKLQTQKLKDLYERVLTYRYVACLTFGEIAREMNYTKRYVGKIHTRALKALGL